MTAPTRPVLRYHGGKWRLAPWILSFFPEHRIYVEPFGGGGAVLVQKMAASIEVYNDLDSEVVNVFRVLRSPTMAAELARLLALTPYAREEWAATFDEPSELDPIEHARRIIVRSFMGHGMKGAVSNQATGFHTALSDEGRYSRVTSWQRMPAAIADYVERLRGVLIENCDAIDLIARFDAPDALFYCDPPYLGHSAHYRHRFENRSHERLAEVLSSIDGAAIVSGYPHPLLDDLYRDWERHEKTHRAFAAAARTEVVWIKRAGAAVRRIQRSQFELSEVAS